MDFVDGGAVVRIDVGALESGQVVRAVFDEHIASGSSEFEFDTPVEGQLEVARTRTFVRLRGKVGGVATLVCGRCLTAFRRSLETTLDEEFPLPDGGAEPADAESGLLPGPAPVLDITEVIRQHLLLAAPMTALCTPDCRGLCPQCGVNRSEVDCGHEVQAIDPRWAPLQTLKIQERE